MKHWSGHFYNEGHNDEIFDKLHEECGVFAVYGHEEAANLCYYGLHALQHRGQESAGICTNTGTAFHHHRGMGLVKEAFTTQHLQQLKGDTAIAHVRYSTSGESKVENAQPLVLKYREGDLAIATNGNIVNAKQLRAKLERDGSIFQTSSDTEVVAHLIARSKCSNIVDAVKEALSHIEGAYAFLFMTKDKLIAALDPGGFRPFSIGKLGEAFIFASETCAFDAIGATYLRDVQPGELIVMDEQGMQSETYMEDKKSICAMEYIYFARPDSDIQQINVHTARKRMGKQLALESFVDADVVTGVPDSSISAAIGFAEQTGIPYELGLVKNRYAGRTFIQPSQELREQGVKMKLSAVRKVVEGKRVVMIDDSIVRGTTSMRIVNMLREAGAKEVHVRITSPPFKNPCFYGIDTPTSKELIASEKTVAEICEAIQADSLHFLSEQSLIKSIGNHPGLEEHGMCLACFNHQYPTEVYQDESESESKQTCCN
ncbi:amidophosphoribosyltransferase [Longirhabdus pacifica]|uniref:amidophosphoribosyltransferase n=1 Tax=Longirhabdus pacifica TaxID=2305227 RepID=UPI00100921AF|nr:amidophosphoribosyltransferase [Longirhabdus pacifica]